MDKPEYIPIPRTGTKCPYCGLSRSGIYNLIRPTKANGYKAVVKSSVVRLPGKNRGRRMVHYASMMDCLNAQVVPVELLNLRTHWVKFRSELRQGTRKPTQTVLAPETLDDLPPEAEMPEMR
jgi:hypothetical protein